MGFSNTLSFGKLFRKFRLKSEFSSLSEFTQALADEGLIYEDSTLSRWQNGNRIPTDRGLLVTLIKIFVNRGGMISLPEANMLLESASQGYLTELEIEKISSNFVPANRFQLTQEMVDFMFTVGKSKRLLRSGPVREGIKNPESVAEHSFRVGVIAMVLSSRLDYKVDKEKLIKMALIHDIGEIVTGDIVIQRGEIIDLKLRDEKEKKERIGIKQIFDQIKEGDVYAEIFEEMITRKSPEAKIFWQFDKLEMALTAFEYEIEQGKNMEEFFLDAESHIEESLLKKILREILKRRQEAKKLLQK